jgi:hypothetical protein
MGDPVRSLLIFLHLLERESQGIGKDRLADAEQRPAEADPIADMDVDGIWKAFAGHAAGGFAWSPRHSLLQRSP